MTASKPFWEVNNSLIKDKAQQLCHSNDPVSKKASSILEFVNTNLTYNNQKGFENRLGALGALKNPTNAVCGEFADLFIALARACGIPARGLEGYVANSRQLGDVLHMWAEYFDADQKMWIVVDPTWKQTDPNRLILAIHGLDSRSPLPAGAYKLDTDEKDQIIVNYGEEFAALSTAPSSYFDSLKHLLLFQ